MKRRKTVLVMLVAFCCILCSACSPILQSFDPNNVQLDRRVPEKREQKGVEVSEQQLTELIAEVNREKYELVEGTDAYYLLPTGTPLPEGLIDFQPLGLVDDRITYYAYQALYASDDSAGLGGMQKQGTAAPWEDVKIAKNIHHMVTVLMQYDTMTQQYRVLYHTLEEVVVSYQIVDDGTDVGARRLRVSPASALPEGVKATDALTSEQIRALPLAEKIHSQVLADGSFLFYHNGIATTYDRNGQTVYVSDIRNFMKNMAYVYGPTGIIQQHGKGDFFNNDYYGTDVCTIMELTADSQGFLYLTLALTRKELNIRDGINQDSIKNPESDLVQLYCKVLAVDVGTDLASGQERLGNCFRSENLNYQAMVDEWMKSDGAVLTYPEKPTEAEINTIFGTQEELEAKYNLFGAFRFGRKEFPAVLYFGSGGAQETSSGSEFSGSNVTPDNLPQIIENTDAEQRLFLVLPEGGEGSKEKDFQTLPFEKRVKPSEATEVKVLSQRTITVRYPADPEDEDSDMVTMEITQEAYFTEALETYFPAGTNVLRYSITLSDCSLAPSMTEGVVKYQPIQSGYGEGEWIVWEGSTKTRLSGAEAFIKEERVKKLAVTQVERGADQAKSPALLMSGENALYFGFPSQNAALYRGGVNMDTCDWYLYRIPYDEMTEDPLYIGTEFYFTGDRMAYRKKQGKEWLYLAGLSSGILKVNLSMADSDSGNLWNNTWSAPTGAEGRVSRISPYAYFGLWTNEQGSTCKAIGYQTTDYSYNSQDQFRAKLYTVALEGKEEDVRMVSYVFSRDSDLQRRYLLGEEGLWDRVLANTGVSHPDSEELREYRKYLVDEIIRRQEARRQLGTMAGIVNQKNETSFPDDAFWDISRSMEELESVEDLEKLLVSVVKARDALKGFSPRSEEAVLAQLKGEAAGEDWKLRLQKIVDAYHPDFSHSGYVSYYKEHGGMDEVANVVRTRKIDLYYGSENYTEISKVAGYIQSAEEIQERILTGDPRVWKEIYNSCGLSKASIQRRIQGYGVQIPWVQDYEDYINEKAQIWQEARESILDLAGLDGEDLAEERAYFRQLLSEDLEDQEKDAVNTASIEKMILSLCRKWSGMEEIESMSDYQIIKQIKQEGGYTNRKWERYLKELLEDLHPDFTWTGFENRGEYAVRKAANRMEDDLEEPGDGQDMIKNPGRTVLEKMKLPDQDSLKENVIRSAWRLFLMEAGLESQLDEPRLEFYFEYLSKEIRDREQVKEELEAIAGAPVPEDIILESRYERSQSADDVETLLSEIYVTRPEIQNGSSPGTGKGQEDSDEGEALTIENMVNAMKTEGRYSGTQWETQMTELLDKMKLDVTYEGYQEYGKAKNQKEKEEQMAQIMQQRERAYEIYRLALRLLYPDFSAVSFRTWYRTKNYSMNFDQYYSVESNRDGLNAVIACIAGSQSIQKRLLQRDPSVWYEIYSSAGNAYLTDLVRNKRKRPVVPGAYEDFCAEQARQWDADQARLLTLLKLPEIPGENETAFYEEVLLQSQKWR